MATTSQLQTIDQMLQSADNNLPSLLSIYGLNPSGSSSNTTSSPITSATNSSGNFNVNDYLNQLGAISLSNPTGSSSNSLPTTVNPTLSTPANASSVLSALTNPLTNAVTFNPSDFAYPDIQPLIKQAYDALAPYYTQLLTESNGDVNLALQNLQTDTQMGLRDLAQSTAQSIQNTTENLQGALEQFGIQFPQEKQQLLDTLNQRGMAVTENRQTGGLNVGTEGRGGYETSQLSQDQQLRQEAVQRSAQQQIQGAQLSQQQGTEKIQQQNTEQTQSIAQQQRTYQEQLDQQRQQQALQQAQLQQQNLIGKQQANIQQKQYAAATGQGSTNSNLTDAQKHINPSTGHWDDNYYSQTYG